MTESVADSDLHLVVYTSIASSSLKIDALDKLIEEARRFNHENSVTGVLVYSDGVFVQAIEGGKGVIEELYGRIADDERHHAVVTLENGSLDKRRFSEWSMGFEYSNSSGEEHRRIRDAYTLQQLFESKNGIELVKLLEELDVTGESGLWTD